MATQSVTSDHREGEWDAALARASRRAFQASSLPVLGMARLTELDAKMETGREQICVFHDRELAMKWLGIEVPRV